MKKTNKHLLMAGGIFCAAGLLIFGAGIASGGKEYIRSADLNRISGAAMMDSSDSHAILSKTKIDAFSAVNIDLRNIDLDVKESDDGEFYIAYNIETSDGMLPLSYQVQNDTLNVVEKKGHESYSYIHIDINFLQEMLGQSHVIENSNKLTLYIPRKTDLSSFSCKMGYGTLDAESLNTKQAEITNEDGEITVKDSSFKNLKLEAELGDVNFRDVSCTDSQIILADGDMTAENIVFNGENKIVSSLGDIELTVPKKELANLSVQAETKLGDIEVPDELGSVISDDDTEVLQADGTNKNMLTVESSDGDIEITVKK